MSPPASNPRVIAFGDLEGGVWGAAWWGPPSFATVGVVGAPPLTLSAATILDGEHAGEEWRLRGDGVELMLTAAGDAVRRVGDDDEPGRFDQLCHVKGLIVVEGAQRAVGSLGWRGRRAQRCDPDRFESLREVSAWYEPDEGIVVSSLRPRGARGHADDVTTAALLAPGVVPVVCDPRLSTTYTATGEPARMTLELWLDGDEQEAQYPRRAAGEAVGSCALASRDGLEFRARLLRSHSAGRDGAGVYLLIRCG